MAGPEWDADDDVDSGYGTGAATGTAVTGSMVDGEADGVQAPASGAFKRPAAVSDRDWKVYEVLDAITAEFDEKFRKMWA